MKLVRLSICYWFVTTTCGFTTFASSQTPEQRQLIELLQRVDEIWRGKSSTGKMSMEVKTKYYQRKMSIRFWSEGDKNFLARIEEPIKEKGTSTLKIDNVIYNYLPKIDRTIKIGSSMMGGSWMGSHITNDDLVKSSKLASDYLITKEPNSTATRWNITLTPKKDSAVVWGKILLILSMPDAIPVEQQFFDEDFKLARTMHFSQIKAIAGRKVPLEMLVKPAQKPEEYTKITYTDISFDTKMPTKTFSLQNLKRAR